MEDVIVPVLRFLPFLAALVALAASFGYDVDDACSL